MLRLPVAIVLASLAQLAFAQDPGPPVGAGEPSPAGTVSLIDGDVRFLDVKQQARRPKVGDTIYEGEGIVTGADGEVHLDMQDGGYIGVRPGTQLNIVNFKAEGGQDDGFLLSLFEGSFRSVTGWITRSTHKRADVQTPTVTIGVRGTDYEPLVIPEGSKTGEAGTYNRVTIGETEMRGAQGSVVVKPNQAGFVPRRGAAKPRLLDRVPPVFRTTKNEKRFEGLHERIHKNLEQRRQQRVKQIEQRRKAGPKAAAQKSAGEQRREDRKREQLQREDAQKQKRSQEADKRERQREAQKAALKAQKQAEERRLQREHDKASKKSERQERRKRHAEKRE